MGSTRARVLPAPGLLKPPNFARAPSRAGEWSWRVDPFVIRGPLPYQASSHTYPPACLLVPFRHFKMEVRFAPVFLDASVTDEK